MSTFASPTRAWRAALAACALASLGPGASEAVAPVPPVPVAAPRPVAVRVTWGGGRAQAWAGTVRLVAADGGAAPEPEWRTLCTEPDAAAMVHAEGGTLVVHQPRPVANDGVEILVPAADGWRLVAALGPPGAAASATVDVAVADLVAQEAVQPLDGDGNRLAARLAPGEQLRVTIDTPDGLGGAAACRPGDRLGITVDALLPARADGNSALELRLRLRSRPDGDELPGQVAALVPLPDPQAAPAEAGGRRAVRFDRVRFDVAIPAREGEWDLALEAVEAAGLGWKRTLATRTLPLVTVAAEPVAAGHEEWRVVYELDPGSPRLHERLRRLPGVDLPGVSLPQVPLPSLTRPSLPRLPQVPLPSVPLPSVPLPQVPTPSMPQLSTIVPRLSGLLAAGHSRLEPHLLGPMLRLPPAAGDDAFAWEGIVIAGARPQAPHVVEIEFPTDQRATVGVAVLEADATGSRVEPRHLGGFEIEGLGQGEQPRLGVHRFAFWPATRHPVILLTNQSRSTPALVGHVRILSGARRLAAATPAAGRKVHAYLDDPAFVAFGATGDWPTRVAAVTRSAEVLAAQGAGGAMLVVHAGGAALWPSRCSRQAPRWGCGAGDAGGPATTPDLLATACRSYEREGLRLVPAVVCDAPLPALEAELARGGAGAVGITCVGRDGRPARPERPGTASYNVLDPRVQRAVMELVGELTERLRGAAAVDGVALVLPHDGWLHLPGVAWGLDDATFARFRAAVGVDEPAGDDRFAARAALVEGPLRERWLEWRAAEVARFHARLADVVAAADPRWNLSIVPTTLCSEGAFAARFRPRLGRGPAADAPLREAGLDPVRSTAHRRVVFVAPHVRSGGDLDDASLVDAGNLAAARAAAAAARRGTIVVERTRPLDVATVVPHGPFGTARPPEPLEVAIQPVGAGAGRPLAEAFAAGDPEAVFDARLGLAVPAQRPADRAVVEALPPVPLESVTPVPMPLVVRTRRGDGETWLHVVNASATPVQATLGLVGRTADAMDMISGAALEVREARLTVDLPAWGMRVLRLGGAVTVADARLAFDPALVARVTKRVEQLGRRRESLERPAPLDVLDNPGFELGGDDGPRSSVTGWELVEPRRGSLAVVTGGEGRAAAFASTNGLATLRSNPFAPPASGRVSVAARLRIRDGDPQPPLRVAIEGIRDDREYYRFAAVGGLTGGRPLTGDWQQFVLQVDDLPAGGLESLRVRFDLLGPGAVEIDDVLVFDLAFDEAERVMLTRQITALEAAVEAGEVGACVVALDSHWPRYLERHVPLPPAPAAVPAEPAPAGKPAERTGMMDRLWRWWQ